jgi:hypothetical protein
MSISRKITEGAGSGSGGGSGGYVDDVFSTYLYEGNGADRDIVNGVDLDGEGGLVWTKARSDGWQHALYDTERGAGKRLGSNSTAVEEDWPDTLSSFNSDGFSLGADSTYYTNKADTTYTSWTFRKAPKFFDVVTYTGDGVEGREIPHNLGCEVGMLVVKRTDTTGFWPVYHRGMYANDPDGAMQLNDTGPSTSYGGYVYFGNGSGNVIPPTDSVFTVGADYNTNESNGEYVAYLFAHDDSDESIIKCGSFTESTSEQEIDLGFEPQWLMIKTSSSTMGWRIFDMMRGFDCGGSSATSNAQLEANSSSAEEGSTPNFKPTPTGFTAPSSFYGNGTDFIYMAIRRPNKPAEEFEAEELFNTVSGRDDGKSPSYELGFPTDMAIQKAINGSADGHYIFSRPTGNKLMFTNESSAESTGSSVAWDYMNGVMDYFDSSAYNAWGWRRAPGFFDVVSYAGDGQAGREVPHNLAVAPEMMWIKRRNGVADWPVYYKDAGQYQLKLNERDAPGWDYTDGVSDTTFTLKYGGNETNQAGGSYIAYLFASVPGICDIGSYTAINGNQEIDCGFTNGARFVLIKRTDSTGDWMLFDTVRGISGSGSPLLKLNETDAQESGAYVDPFSKGFIVSNNRTGVPGGEYIYMAIA